MIKNRTLETNENLQNSNNKEDIEADDEDDDEYISNLKKNFNIEDNVSNCSDNLSDNDLNNYKLNNELVALANEVSKTFNSNDLKQKIGSEGETGADLTSSSSMHYMNDDTNDDPTASSKKINYYDIDDECLMPEFDWANLEAKLKEESMHREYLQQKNDRDEIRRKLATDTEYDTDYIPDYLKKGISTKSHLGQNLQICFMNESISDCENSNDSQSDKEQHITTSNSSLSTNSNDHRTNKLQQAENSNNTLLKRFISNSTSSYNLANNKNESLFTKQLKLQQETKQALEIAQHEARVRIELEQQKQAKIPSPLADIVGLPTYGIKRLDKRTLNRMNIGKLQLIENDLRNQIEKTNEDLKLLLIDRDELYVQQDSILIDIEDLTKRLQDYAHKLNSSHNSTNNNNKPTEESQIKASKSSNEILNLNSNINRLNKMFPISTITNKLYRFTKK